MIQANLIKHSISENGDSIATFELEYPRYIHDQILTHRAFSRNAQSSRAIPVRKRIEMVKNNPVIPMFTRNKKGMSSVEYLEGDILSLAKFDWLEARDNAVEAAEKLLKLNVHKQNVNRLLDPFSTIKVIITATDYDNFFNLRIPDDAQPEISKLAKMMKELLDNSTPSILKKGKSHLPYITEEELSNTKEEDLIYVSVARCARVSYLNHDKTETTLEQDEKLTTRLFEDKHMSPFEHIATPLEGQYANFKNWMSYRYFIENHFKVDSNESN